MTTTDIHPDLLKSNEREYEHEQMTYTVSQLNQTVRDLLSRHFPAIWVEGEISNLARPASGHLYFSLKDERAQLRSAFFQRYSQKLDFALEDGMHVLCKGNVSLYTERGDYQLIVEEVSEIGSGALQKAFEALKKRLDKKGLFATETKQRLPTPIQTVGVITSPSGAVIRDIISVLGRRFPAIRIVIYPSAVQGAEAAPQLIKAIHTANTRQECDVLILARGGGSLEDLWAFNDENLAYSIAKSQLPIVSAVGHEVDYSISDFVADFRAATPSAAAELVSPESVVYHQQFNKLDQYIHQSIHNVLRLYHQQVTYLSKCLTHPKQRLEQNSQRLDYLEHNLYRTVLHRLGMQKERIQALGQRLDTLSPLATLDRGYAIISCDTTAYNTAGTATEAVTKKGQDRQIIRHAQQVSVGDKITAQLSVGKLHCYVDQLELDTNDSNKSEQA